MRVCDRDREKGFLGWVCGGIAVCWRHSFIAALRRRVRIAVRIARGTRRCRLSTVTMKISVEVQLDADEFPLATELLTVLHRIAMHVRPTNGPQLFEQVFKQVMSRCACEPVLCCTPVRAGGLRGPSRRLASPQANLQGTCAAGGRSILSWPCQPRTPRGGRAAHPPNSHDVCQPRRGGEPQGRLAAGVPKHGARPGRVTTVH